MISDLDAEIFKPYKNIELYLFGSSGFSDDLKKVDDKRLHLVDLEEMFDLK